MRSSLVYLVALLAGSTGWAQTLPSPPAAAPAPNAAPAAAGDEPDDAAQLVSSRTQVFIQVSRAAHWRQALERLRADTLTHDLLVSPRMDNSWVQLQTMLNLTGDELFDRMFGRQVAVAVYPGSTDHLVAMFCRIDPSDGRMLVERAQLQRSQRLAPVQGFTFYRTVERGGARVGLRSSWMIVSQPRRGGLIAQLLDKTEGQSLAEDPVYRQWQAHMPHDAAIRAFVHREPDQVHIAWVHCLERTVTIHYRGQAPALTAWLCKWDIPDQPVHPPLPASVYAVAELHAIDHDPSHYQTDALDQFLAPKNFRQDVLPRLDSPLVFFSAAPGPGSSNSVAEEDHGRQGISEANPPDASAENPASPEEHPASAPAEDNVQPLHVPVLGFCFRLRDRSLADDLDRWITTGLLAVNLNPNNDESTAPVITVQTRNRPDGFYRLADIGHVLADRTGKQVFQHAELVFGRIRQWYFICSSETFFNQCDQVAAGTQTISPLLAGMDNPDDGPADAAAPATRRPLVSVVVQTTPVAAQLRQWLEHEERRIAVTGYEMDQLLRPSPYTRWVRASANLCGTLDQCRGLSMRLWADEQNILHGRIRFIAADATAPTPACAATTQP
ncbi:MAG: hypothetical protein IT440_11525 [Phycisphaeraceae bacterium]|nr:hypothetical protein [Phycisphaeraceae bacterium]